MRPEPPLELDEMVDRAPSRLWPRVWQAAQVALLLLFLAIIVVACTFLTLIFAPAMG